MRRRLVTLILVLAAAWGGLALSVSQDVMPLLGLDLRGGVSVILEAPAGTERDLLEVAVNVMRNRIEGIGNVQEPEISIAGDRSVLIQLPGVTDQEEALEVLGQTGELSFRPVFEDLPVILGATVIGGESVDIDELLTVPDDTSGEAWLAEYDDQGQPARVYRVGGAELAGSDIANATPVIGQDGRWVVSLDLTSGGSDAFAELTKELAGYPFNDPRRELAIVLDGEVVTAPPISTSVSPVTGITGGRAQISIGGDDPQGEAQDLAVVLRYGSLPVALERVSLQKVSATLGSDSLRAGVAAGGFGLGLVAMALLAYYRSLGLVAVVGLTVFGSFLILVFSLLGLALGLSLTLAGVTGIIVSVGITADSYIVYFERIKEEIRGGFPVAEAVTEGFIKAYRTILTADTVSILGALLLYILAVGPVKGFALALGVATVLDLIVARLYTRHAVGLLASTGLGDRGRFSIRGAAGEVKA